LSKDHFALPGSELLNPSVGKSASPHKEIFAKPKGGGGGLGRASKPAPTNNQPEEDLVPDAPKPEPPAEPLVKLTNPKFLVPDGHFEEKVPFSIDADLPASLKDVKRVIVTAWSIPKNGEKQQAFSKDFYIDDNGKVTGDVELRRPSKYEGKEVESCPYVFTAKHRDSKEIESPRLPVKEKPRGNDELVLELTSSEKLKTEGFAFHLKSKDGSVDSKIETKNGEEKEGVLTLKFTKLDPKLEYSLDMINPQGKILESIFPNTAFGKWAEGAK
jgi:hypothetical protein